MPKVEVVTVTSRVPGPSEPYYRYATFINSLARFGVAPTVLGMGEHWGGLMTKPRRLRDYLQSGRCEADILIVTDSYDVVFTAPPEEVADRYEKETLGDFDPPIIFNAEKGLFPRGELKEVFDAFADTLAFGSPWKYLNSGFYIGRPADILKMLAAFWLDDIHDDYQAQDGRWIHPNDQGWYQTIFCAQPVSMALDYQADIVQCCSASELSEFDITGERVRNIVTETEPLVWHFNGGSKDSLMPFLLEKWGLT